MTDLTAEQNEAMARAEQLLRDAGIDTTRFSPTRTVPRRGRRRPPGAQHRSIALRACG